MLGLLAVEFYCCMLCIFRLGFSMLDFLLMVFLHFDLLSRSTFHVRSFYIQSQRHEQDTDRNKDSETDEVTDMDKAKDKEHGKGNGEGHEQGHGHGK